MVELPVAKRQVLNHLLRKNARLIGAAASVLALAGFAYAFFRILTLREVGEMLRGHWAALVLALVFYVATYAPMSIGWIMLARGCGARAGCRPLAQVYLVAQIGKYLPGNVGHLLGRAFLARRYGVPIEVSGAAMTYEIAGVLAAGALLATAAGVLSPSGTTSAIIPLSAAALAMTLMAAVLFLRRRTSQFHALGALAAAVVCYLAVFLLMIGANMILLGAVGGNYSETLVVRTASAVVLSWLVGFMVPGAPAGLGLREISFYTLLAGVFSGPTVLFAAAGMRLVTATGDGITWLAGLALDYLSPQSKPPALQG